MLTPGPQTDQSNGGQWDGYAPAFEHEETDVALHMGRREETLAAFLEKREARFGRG